jgi:hypothetical protein
LSLKHFNGPVSDYALLKNGDPPSHQESQQHEDTVE